MSLPFEIMRLLYLCEAETGGIVEYAVRQIAALAALGVEVTVLCRPGFAHDRFRCHAVSATLPERQSKDAPKWRRLIRQIEDGRVIARRAADLAARGNFDGLLIACYAEYFSPFWAGILRNTAKRGLVIGTIAHDPVRDFVLGPLWWHRWSVREGYSFVRHVFVHDETPVDFGGTRPQNLATHVIPHGPYEVSAPVKDRAALRHHYGFDESDTVFLSFGQIRDGKNLDRFLRAMTRLPETVKLLVAGLGEAASQRSPDYYVGLAASLGIAKRCVWDLRYIPDAETGNLFEVADHILLTYSAKFRSASGVLNTAVACRKPVLASSGPGPLQSVVEAYRLGVFVTPDDDEAILTGAGKLIAGSTAPNWEVYARENSWEKNAVEVIRAFVER